VSHFRGTGKEFQEALDVKWENVTLESLVLPPLFQKGSLSEESKVVQKLKILSDTLFVLGDNPALQSELESSVMCVYYYGRFESWMSQFQDVTLLFSRPEEFVSKAVKQEVAHMVAVFVYSKKYDSHVKLLGERLEESVFMKRTRERYAIESKSDYDHDREILLQQVIKEIPEEMKIEMIADGNAIGFNAAQKIGREVTSSDLFPKDSRVSKESMLSVIKRVKGRIDTVVIASWLYGLLSVDDRESLISLQRLVVLDQRLITGLWQVSSSGRVWAKGLDFWLEDGPLSVLIPKPYFPFFLRNVHKAYDLSRLSEADQLSILRFFVLHGIRPGIKTIGLMQSRFEQEGFVRALDGVAVITLPERSSNIILRANGQTAFMIVDNLYKVMGLNQVVQIREDVTQTANVMVVKNKQGSSFVYFKETGLRRVQVAGLVYLVNVIDYWEPSKKQVPVVRTRKRPGMREGIEEDPGPDWLIVILILSVALLIVVSLCNEDISACEECIFTDEGRVMRVKTDEEAQGALVDQELRRVKPGIAQGVDENPGPEFICYISSRLTLTEYLSYDTIGEIEREGSNYVFYLDVKIAPYAQFVIASALMAETSVPKWEVRYVSFESSLVSGKY
jgi:hypothetical protein